MPIFQKKKLSKFTILLLQVVALASLFLFCFSREAIYIFKDFVDRIPMDATFEGLIYRVLLPFKLISNTPSLCAVIFLTVHIFCATYSRDIFGYQFLQRFNYKDFDINMPQSMCVVAKDKNGIVYLQTMRLLF